MLYRPYGKVNHDDRVYCTSAGQFGIARAIAEIGHPRPFASFHDLTNVTRRQLAKDVIDQKIRLTGEQSVIRLLGRSRRLRRS